MKKPAIHQLAFLLSIILLLLLGSAITTAQSDNLLTNPGFEGSFISFEGDTPREVAQGWAPWHVPQTDDMPSYQNIQPKYQAAAPDASRIRNGSNAQMYFSFFESHDGGVYQSVTGIEPNAELRFSVYAYVWSSTYNDVNLSEDPGNVLLQVGIDPTGGTNGESNNIVWSVSAEQYDAYREYSVIATATNSTVTVFVRSIVAGFPVQHSQVFLDDAVLAITTEPADEPTDTEEPSDTPVPPTEEPTKEPTEEPLPPTEEPTDEPPPTAEGPTEEPPTETPVPATNTPMPPTDTPAPPTPTPETVVEPTDTPFTVPTATNIPGGGPDESTTPISEAFPGRIIHTVRRGDTVSRLATLYGSTNGVISEANGLSENTVIYVGQGLVIPVRIPNPATETPTYTPVVIVVTATPAPPVTTVSAENVYYVQPGDTLLNIASRFNTTVATLAQLNGIVNANLIYIGQRLMLPVPATGGAEGGIVPTSPPGLAETAPTPEEPAPVTYVVQPGDNLYRISLRFNVSIQRLADINGITNYNQIFIGQVLTMP